MLIVGAKGFAKEVLEILHGNGTVEDLLFYDDVTPIFPDTLYGKFPVLKALEDAEKLFASKDNRFTIGLGNPCLRARIAEKFTAIGGKLVSTISDRAVIGSYGVTVGEGTNILQSAIISNDVQIGKGNIIYFNAVLTHDVVTGDFVEISPSVNLLGRCRIGEYTSIGANSTVLPDISVGKNVIIGAGSVVTKNLPDNCTAVGVPAKIIKIHE